MSKYGLDAVHKLRFIKARVQGKSLEDIALEESVTVATIESSILAYDLWKACNSHEHVLLEQGGVIMDNLEREKEAIRRALVATRKEVITYRRGGKEIDQINHVADHDVRLRAVELITQKLDVITPKKGISVSNTTNVGVALPGSSGISFEDRLRKIQEKRKGLLPAAEEIPEAEIVEAEAEECIPLN